ncbi:cytoplasmic protein [Herbaspirillum sp. meg3]|uniref:winged helix-turn-helix domain-containing protein n=1 Tax=Herbaspirillum sp. meg3 TaxID=2025949 RepID=UPI000B9991B2|nr:crosslink repair DNA glycosylase YcaQ family protein [Herbaspirillum sp. meg3]ASU39136.1 cytoplasmic protein [Herbaspirillum sp. meg3]
MSIHSIPLSPAQARAIWLCAQRLDEPAPFGAGAEAVRLATEHLGYVQIDTINVIERSHHHILYTRIPDYKLNDLEQAQSVDKSVFEYWTHALAYVPTTAFRHFIPAMEQRRLNPHSSFDGVDEADYAALLKRIRKEGGLSIRDIEDDVLVEKTHPWGSRKPSKKALRWGFFIGDLVISKRTGMIKTYELAGRHFGWQRRPAASKEKQFAKYLTQRALQSQGIVSLDSICYGNAPMKAMVKELIAAEVKRKQLVPVHLDGAPKSQHWITQEQLETVIATTEPVSGERVHILSPFDPLVIQRKRLELFFGYEHRFEAYVPAEKRVLGYFALPVLAGDRIVAAIDLKMDRQAGKLRMQKWSWIAKKSAPLKSLIEEELHRFEQFQKQSMRSTQPQDED